MRTVVVMLLALGASGCASTQIDYDVEVRAYAVCVTASAKAVASQTGDPVSLAYGARAMCGQSEVALRQKIMSQRSPTQAARLMDTFRDAALESATADIVKARLGR